MCGIVGFTGNRQAAPILLDGLSKLEYRGYDSAGLAVRDGENLAQVVKAKGRLSNLIEKTDGGKALKGTCGIGHTRWATHGEPSQTNAHPHVSGNCTRSGSGTVESEVVGVHNGIIENYAKRKNLLMGSNPIIAPDSEMLWNAAIVWRILRRYEYTGALVMGRRKKIDVNKSKKNNNDRTQYRQKNHHEAIVSREVFNAANHLRASRNYSKKNRPLPVLSVVEDGILRGYVPFDKDWTGFSAEEYREASESVMKEPDVTVTADVKKRLDLTGYEIVRVQYFSTMQNPAMTISNGRLRFNTACLKKFENVEYVELLLNSVERCIAIRPCDKNNPNAIRWGRLKEGRWCASTLGCRGLAKTLFDIMEWDEDLRYRFRGQFLEQGDNKMMLFAFDEPEMIKVEEIVLPPKENTEEDEGETVKKKIYIFPPEWAGTFGQPITSIAQVGILRQEHYAGNWDVFRPATEIEEMNIFTAESLNELLREAEKIMEGWTDYR